MLSIPSHKRNSRQLSTDVPSHLGQEKNDKQCWQGWGMGKNSLYPVDRMQIIATTVESIMEVSQKTKNKTTLYPAI
jgi:hypothetical protein